MDSRLRGNDDSERHSRASGNPREPGRPGSFHTSGNPREPRLQGSFHTGGREVAARAHPDLAAARGFVLPELLVVLLLLGLLGALALPNLERLQGAVTKRTERDYVLDQIAGLGRQAMLKERAYVVLGTRREGDADISDPARMTRDAAREQPRPRLSGTPDGPASHPDHEHYVIDLPEGWEIRLDEPLVVYANGVCLGAELTLYVRGAEDLRTVLDPPYCRVDPDA